MLPVNHVETGNLRNGLDACMERMLGIGWDLDGICRRLTCERQFGRKDLGDGV